MGLQDTSTIDIITKPFPGDNCKLVLFVVDDGSIADELQRFQLLKSKLLSYVNFVSSEEFQRDHPEINPTDVLVRVVYTTPPNEAMLDVQAIGAKGDVGRRLRVVFTDRVTFLANLKAR